MVRTVKVGLAVDEQPYVRGVGRAERATEQFDAAVDGLAGSAKGATVGMGRAADAIDEAGDTARGSAREFDRLSDEIAQTQRRVKSLAAEIGRNPDDAELLKKFGAERSQLARLNRVRRALDEIGDAAGRVGAKTGTGGAELFATIGTRLPSPHLIAAAGLAVAAVAPIIGAGIAAAVIGGAGAGGIVGGIAGAARDPRVKASWKALADEGSAALGAFSGPFVTPTLRSLDVFRNELHGLRPELAALGADAARGLEPLARGLAGLIREALPGFRSLMREAGPLIEVAAQELPGLGKAIGDFADSMADAGPGAQKFFRFLIRSSELLLVLFGRHVEMLATIFELMSRIPGPLKELTEGGSKKMKGLGDAGASAFDSIEQAAADAKAAVAELNQKFDDAFNKVKNLDQAAIDFKLGMIDLAAEIKENGRKLDGNSEAGLRNRDALVEQIDKAKELRDAEIDRGNGTQEATDTANAAYEAQLGQIRKLAVSLGLPKAAVDELINRYRALALMPDLTKTVRVRFIADNKIPGGPSGLIFAQAKGGIVAAQHGMIADSPTVLFGERETVREAFIPKEGISRERGLALGAEAMSWHRASVVPWERSNPAAAQFNADVKVFLGTREISDLVRVEIRQHDRGVVRRVRAGTGTR